MIRSGTSSRLRCASRAESISVRAGSLLCWATLCLLSSVPARAITCNVRTSPMTAGDIAMARGDYVKAESLYAGESKSGPEADRTHAALIRAQLRQSKIADAEKDAVAWSTAQPKNPWALVAISEVRWREGRPDDTLRTLETIRTLDYCNPQAHADLANLYRMRGLYASANRELTLARKFDPVDAQIEFAWLHLQPPATRLTEITDLLSNAAWLSADQINGLSREKQRLFEAPPSGCHLVSPVTSTSIPFRAMQNGPQAPTYWGLDVGFDGKQRRLKIDTGASGLLLSKSAANALHLEPSANLKIHGIGDDGDVDSYIAKVHSIKIGGLEFQDCYVQVLGITPKTMAADDGLIGGDVFSHFLLTFDFPGRALKLDPLPTRPDETAGATPTLDTGVAAAFAEPQDAYRDPSMKDWDAVWRSGHDLIMNVRLNAHGPWRLFLLDTGSSMDLISPDAASEVAKVDKGSWTRVAGISGEVKKTWTTGPMKLYFSHFVAPVQGMVAIDTSRLAPSAGFEISGLIGTPTLHQFTLSIDYRDNLVHFSYDPSRLTRCVAGVKFADCY
ncbi:MAG TPA: aspartyl protease family protein [Acidobacteriaceae bacterium]|nr:aspartyl protease family protein [Acidobacteriaceae bacterium]